MKETNKPLKTPESKEAVKMLYIELGPSEAARRIGKPINTVTKWASRYGWKRLGQPFKAGRKPSQVSEFVVTPSEGLEHSIKETGVATRGAIAQATLSVAQEAQVSAEQGRIPICSASHLKDLAAAAARVFGWDSSGKGTADTHNTLVITSEQLDQIRALRDPEAYS